MEDLFDRFTGSGTTLASHVADSGDTWSDPAGLMSCLSPRGAYASGSLVEGNVPLSSWTPPGTDHAVAIVLGPDFAAAGNVGFVLRASGSPGSETYYGLEFIPGSPSQWYIYSYVGGTFSFVFGPNNITLSAFDELRLNCSGSGASVDFEFLQNGASVASTSDTGGTRITVAGAVGLRISGSTSPRDSIYTLWAGAIGGPTAGISPSSAVINMGAAVAFSATGTLPNETLNWTTTDGSSLSPTSGTSTTYTAPGPTTLVTWTSADLPTHTATATITLGPPVIINKTTNIYIPDDY